MKQSELVDACLSAMRESSAGPADTARDVLAKKWLVLDATIKMELAVCGLAHLVGDKYARLRLHQPKPNGNIQAQKNRATRRMTRAVGKAVRDHATMVLRSISLHIRGGMRPLFDFTIDDLHVWGQKAQARSESWTARMQWCAEAKEMLTRAKVKTLGELPAKLRNEIAVSAERTWSKNMKKKAVRRAA
jgi:hypothetical protein